MKISIAVLDITLVGGIERVASNMADMFAKGKHTVTVYSFFKTSAAPFYTIDRRVKIIYLSEKKFHLSGKHRMLALYKSMIKSARKLSGENHDVVISLFTNISILISLFGKLTVPLVAAEHGQYFAHGFFIRLMRRYTYKKADAVVALTRTDASIYSQLFGGKGYWIPNGINSIPTIKSSGKKKRVIAVGRLVKEKGFDILIEMAGSFLSVVRGWSLAIYGDGYERKKLTRLVAQNQHPKQIILHGFEKNISRVLADSSIYVCTSHTESFGMAIAEGMACGLPAVSFDCPTGPRDIIEDGVNGFLIPVGDRKLFCERVNLLMRDEKLRINMGRAARKSVEKFLPAKIAVQWNNLLSSLVGGDK